MNEGDIYTSALKRGHSIKFLTLILTHTSLTMDYKRLGECGAFTPI